MDVKHIIVHKIEKEANKTCITDNDWVRKRKGLDVHNHLVNVLIDGILTAYKRGKYFGSFIKDYEECPVGNWFKEYLESQSTNNGQTTDKEFVGLTKFVALTWRLLRRIRDQMEKKAFATGGYFVFAQYSIDSKNYFLVAMVKDRRGLVFTDELEIADVTEIDLNNLHQAARVDIDLFNKNEEPYLSFLKAKNQPSELIEYFTKALCCIPRKPPTKEVFAVVDLVCKKANLGPQETRDARERVYDLLSRNIGKPVTLLKIDSILDPLLKEEHYGLFSSVANSDKHKINVKFEPDGTALIKFRKIKIKTPLWSLNFEREALGAPRSNSDVTWDREGQFITVINIPVKYQQQLNAILKSKTKLRQETRQLRG